MSGKESNFRWRESPGIIAHYFYGSDIPPKVEVTLGPSEICIVLENGAVVGIATQTKMEVNPSTGLLRRALGSTSPDRSFLFVETGPHEVITVLNGKTKAGDTIRGFARITLSVDNEAASKFLKLVDDSSRIVTLGSLAKLLELEANQLISSQILTEYDTGEIRGELAMEDAGSALRTGLARRVGSIGLRLEDAWVSWDETESEKLASMRKDLENLVERNAILSETEFEKIENAYRTHVKKLEVEARLKKAGQNAESRAEADAELESIRAKARIAEAEWESMKSIHIDKERTRIEIEKMESDHLVQVERQRAEISNLAKDRDASRAMEMFEQVQARKRERIAMEQKERESDRAQQERSSERMIDALMKIVESSEDEAVKIEALRQITELRRVDK